MASPLSRDLRERIIAAIEQDGFRGQAAARRFKVGVRTVQRLLALYRETGDVAPRRMGYRGGFALAAHEHVVEEQYAAHPDATLDQHRAMLADKGIVVSRSAVDRFLKTLGLTVKKRL